MDNSLIEDRACDVGAEVVEGPAAVPIHESKCPVAGDERDKELTRQRHQV